MKLNIRRTILIGLAFMSISAFWQYYNNEIPKILKNTYGMGETWTGVIMALDNILALFLLPLFGYLSDRTSTRFGKRMPYILAGTLISSILVMILAVLSGSRGTLMPFIIVLLLLLLAMGIYRSPAVSLMPDLTPSPVRSRANAVINLMGTLGAVYALVMTKKLIHTPSDGSLTNYVPMTLSIAGLMLVCVGILFATINENKLHAEIGEVQASAENEPAGQKEAMAPDVKKSMRWLLISVFLWFTAYNAVTTAFSRYVEQVWNLHDGAYADCLMVATIAAVVSYVPIGWISQRIGRRKMILIGIVAMTACYLTAGFVTVYASWFNILFAVIGFGWAAINVNSYPMVVEMSRSGEIGKFTGTYYTFSMAAQVFTPIASGWLLEHVSYRTLFPYSFVFSALAFATMCMVHHGDIAIPGKKA